MSNRSHGRATKTARVGPCLARERFDHIGLITTTPQPDEHWVEATRVWVTSPRAHPANVEYLRYEPDTPVTSRLRTDPHVAYRVDDVHAAVRGRTVVAEPFDVGDGFVTVAFVIVDEVILEFMQYANPDEDGWFE